MLRLIQELLEARWSKGIASNTSARRTFYHTCLFTSKDVRTFAYGRSHNPHLCDTEQRTKRIE